MDTWTFKMGYPLISVSRNYQTGGAVVTQVTYLSSTLTNKVIQRDFHLLTLSSVFSFLFKDRFLLRKSNSSTDPIVYQWWVPLTYTNDFTQTTRRDWLPVSQVSKTLTSLGASANQWVIFNVDQQSELFDWKP